MFWLIVTRFLKNDIIRVESCERKMNMGLDIHLYDHNRVINEKSEKHPDHYCEKGYLRSSYNSSGFNSVVGNMIGKEMHYIFDPLDDIETEDGDCISPIYPKEHLQGALLRAIEVRDELQHALPFKMETFSSVNIFDKVQYEPIRTMNPMMAYDVFKQKWKKETFPSESELFDYFNEEPFSVHAVIHGTGEKNELSFHVVSKLWNEPFVQSFSTSLPHATGEKPARCVGHDGALSIFADHEKDNRGNYSCFDGHFYLTHPLDVHGIVRGVDLFGKPALHLIYKVSDEYLDYYKQQADIIIEFIEKALTLEQPRIVWSS